MDRPKPDARTVISSLMGHVIPAIDGKPNNILALHGERVIVGTERSPVGEPVDLAEVQAAIDMLWRSGELRVDKRSVGDRSAFIGVVLQSLPEVEVVSRSPRLVRLRSG